MDQFTLGGHWGLAILMIVLASWFVFRALVPKSFKEWRNAGLLQAFIIALYAEMYGFPLTIYVLTSFLGFDIPWLHLKGHLWAALLGFGDIGAIVEMVIGLSFVALGLILVFKGWRQVYYARKEERLVTSGLYHYMRHPQYTGIFLALFGQLIHWPTFLTLFFFPIILLAYYYLARKEEAVLIQRFGSGYEPYRRRVPMFLPTFHDVKSMVMGYLRMDQSP